MNNFVSQKKVVYLAFCVDFMPVGNYIRWHKNFTTTFFTFITLSYHCYKLLKKTNQIDFIQANICYYEHFYTNHRLAEKPQQKIQVP
jgi:hypothetical protein